MNPEETHASALQELRQELGASAIVNRDDPVHGAEVDHHAVRNDVRSSLEPGSGPAGNHANSVSGADREHARHLTGRAAVDHRRGPLPVVTRAIV